MSKPIDIPHSTRLRYKGMYNESRFLQSILDSIVFQSPYHTYELAPIEGMKIYKLIIKNVADGGITATFDIDPRYQCGLGIPMIKVPATNGLGGAGFYWAPLGMGTMLNNSIFSNNKMTSIVGVKMEDMVPIVNIIRSERYLWPDFTLYKSIDMSNLLIKDGKEYQDFGYWIYRVLKSVETATGIKGRFRPIYRKRNDFDLYSDRGVQVPDGIEHKPLDVCISFDGEKILAKSLLNNSEQEIALLPENQCIYPELSNCNPPVFEETWDNLIQFQDAIDIPDPISEFERVIKTKAVPYITLPEIVEQPIQLNPDAIVDVNKEFETLYADTGSLGNTVLKQWGG